MWNSVEIGGRAMVKLERARFTCVLVLLQLGVSLGWKRREEQHVSIMLG